MQYIHVLLVFLFVVNWYPAEAQSVSCTTPNREKAVCIPISSCPILYDSIYSEDPKVVNFIRESQCGYSGSPLVCCGTRASYAPPTSPKPLVRRPELLPDSDTCGQQDVYKILNGQNTSLNEYPWTALIRYRNGSGFEQFSCGGTLINDRYIVTAGHCVVGAILRVVGNPISVRLGEWNTETDPDCFTNLNVRICSDKPINRDIEEIITHSQYDTSSEDRQHDIALIRLDRSVKYTDFVRPVCLPQTTDQVTVGQELDVVGWGVTEKGTYSAIKQKLAVPVVADSQCRPTFRSTNIRLRDTQFCAGGEKGKDSCQRDSGGPLLGKKNDAFLLYGVISFGYECGKEGWPGVYTKVSEYRDWIEGNISE